MLSKDIAIEWIYSSLAERLLHINLGGVSSSFQLLACSILIMVS